MAGLVAIAACQKRAIAPLVHSAVWWHAQGALRAQQQRGVLGVDAWTLSQTLPLVVAGQV